MTLTERTSRFTLIRRVATKTAEQGNSSILDFQSHMAHRKTITADNGREFAAHQTTAASLNIDFYFAHPYASWERCTNENTNGLILQYLPKCRDLSTLTILEELLIMDRLNLRPRKCLGFRTSFEVFFDFELHNLLHFTAESKPRMLRFGQKIGQDRQRSELRR